MDGFQVPEEIIVLSRANPKVCVVYLARAKNGLGPFQTFLESYRLFPAGMEHDLLVVFKGFRNQKDASAYLDHSKPLVFKTFFMRDFGFDLKGYGLAANHFDHSYFCCFNSFSELLHPNWLFNLYEHITRPEVGLAGATGSWESMYSNALQEQNVSLLNRVTRPVRLATCRIAFDPFPNYHIRTTGFIVGRNVARAVWPGHFLTKRSAYLFENGKNSLTKRIIRMGLKPLVVGKDGVAYEKEDWARSRTFRNGDQENLWVADNQTRQYQSAAPETKTRLGRLAWGSSWNPIPIRSAR